MSKKNRIVRVVCTLPQNLSVKLQFARTLGPLKGVLFSEDKKKKEYCYSFKTIKAANQFIEDLKNNKELYKLVNMVLLEKDEKQAVDTSVIRD